jgi:hypothetical protein
LFQLINLTLNAHKSCRTGHVSARHVSCCIHFLIWNSPSRPCLLLF